MACATVLVPMLRRPRVDDGAVALAATVVACVVAAFNAGAFASPEVVAGHAQGVVMMTENHGRTGAVCDVTQYGAVGDNVTNNAAAIAAAVHACSASTAGGTVLFPPGSGTFATGAFNLSSNIRLFVGTGARIRGSGDPDDYPVLPMLPSWGGSYYCEKGYSGGNFYKPGLPRYSPLVYCDGCHNITIEGGGVIDGGGQAWWSRCVDDGTLYDRPHLVQMRNCSGVTIRDVTLQMSANWNTHLVYTDGALLENLYLHNPRVSSASFNTDGIDIDSSRNVVVRGCTVDVNDDAIAMKSGYDEAGRHFAMPTENVVVEDTWLRRGASMAIGSDMSGGVRNVTFQRIRGGDLSSGLYVKTRRGRGGVVRDITLRDSVLNGTGEAVDLDAWYFCVERHPGCADCVPCPVTNATATPWIGDITLDNVTLVGGKLPGGLDGLPEQPIVNVTLRGVIATSATHEAYSPCGNVSGTYDAGTQPPPSCLKPA